MVTKVLYVEDNEDDVYMLKMRLELLGDFEVLSRCVKAVRTSTNASSNSSYSLVTSFCSAIHMQIICANSRFC
jgi:hypothetical protein